MKIRFWGVRGSVPVPGPTTVKYGGNTSCIEIRGDQNEILVIDAGTGLRELGNFLIANDFKNGPLKINILLTHTHWDHIQGFPFFTPAFIPTSEITFHGPVSFSGQLSDVVAGQMTYSYFPIKLDELRANIKFKELQEQSFQLGPFHITTKYLNHPILVLGYRIEYNGKVVVTAYDTEPFRNLFEEEKDGLTDVDDIDMDIIKEAEKDVQEMNEKINRLFSDADLIIHDSQYTQEEYEQGKKGWGHSTIDVAVGSAVTAKAKMLALFHHDPLRSDEQLDEFQLMGRRKARELGDLDMKVFCARERLEITI